MNRNKEAQNSCHFNGCQNNGNLECTFCNKFFCKEHIGAKPPGKPYFKSNNTDILKLREKWENPNNHPCVPFFDHWKIKTKTERL